MKNKKKIQKSTNIFLLMNYLMNVIIIQQFLVGIYVVRINYTVMKNLKSQHKK